MTSMNATRVIITALLAEAEGVRAVQHAMPAIFPWARHLTEGETREFLQDLSEASCAADDQDAEGRLHRVIADWRATAYILASYSTHPA